ncbi:MAG: hypothetical protein ACREIA_26525 [Opitutaceae bacterium]
MEARLGSVGLDGMLRRSYSLIENSDTKRLGLRCTLEHKLERDACGRPRSVWQIPALQSFLVPEGREELRWQSTSGAVVRFEIEKIGRALSEAGAAAGWRIREARAGEYEIRALDGRWWRYVDGLLTAIGHPALGEFVVTTQGGLICDIREAGAGDHGDVLLHAEYDERGHPLLLKDGNDKCHLFQWDEAGHLILWKSGEGKESRFEYAGGLVWGIRGAGGSQERFYWAENPGWRRGDSRWPAPVHLRSDGGHDFAYALSQEGFTIEVRGATSRIESRTIFNPRRHRLEQHAGGETLVFWFRDTPHGTGGLERVETGAGEVLEAYAYDARGQLVGVSRAGESKRELSNVPEIPEV